MKLKPINWLRVSSIFRLLSTMGVELAMWIDKPVIRHPIQLVWAFQWSTASRCIDHD